MASDFLKKYSSVFCFACTHTIKAICYNYKIHPQIFILMYSVAMETSLIMMKMLFFSIFHIYCHFRSFALILEYRTTGGPERRTPDRETRVRSSAGVVCCFLEQETFTPQKVLVIPRNRWLRLNMTEKLFTGTLNHNQNKKKKNRTNTKLLIYV